MITRELLPGIDWVGFIDWNVRDFHSYNTHRGATYNAYLIRDRKTALVDAVKAPYVDDLLRNLGTLTTPASIDYVVCNHGEPDHSGGLPKVMAALPQATLVCASRCRDTLAMYYDTAAWKVQVVATGDTISLGRRTLEFIETPMVHWPDSMFTFVREDKLLFSMDAFGQHLASSERFDDELPLAVVMDEAKTYYANIVMPYGRQVAKTLKEAAGLDIAMIAPSHGVVWRRHIPHILSAYRDWSKCRAAAKVLVLYDSMWESTGEMARAIAEGAALEGVAVRLLHLRRSDLTQVATEALDAAAIAFGSATLNQAMMPMASAALTYLGGLRPTGKVGFAFGSYGWGKGGPEAVDACLRDIGIDILREPLKARYKPSEAVLDECRAAGGMLAGIALKQA